MTVVLNQKTKQEKSEGFAPSRILHALTQVLDDPTIKDARQVPRIVEEWDAAKEKLKIEFGKVVQIAVLTGMLPSDLQDKVFGMSNGGDFKYNRVRDAIVSIMNNRARVLEQTPTDTGQVGGPAREVGDDGYFWDGGEDHSSFDVDAVGRGALGCCHQCSGFGHFARKCPTLEGKGKGKARRVEKVVWISSSRAEASLLKEVGVWESLDSG